MDGPWGSSSVGERADLLEAIAAGIQDAFDALVILESQDTGKPVHTAAGVDIAFGKTSVAFRWSTSRAPSPTCGSSRGP